MTNKLRKLLYPLSILYEGITSLRNKLYDNDILNSKEFDIPLIVVGNLRVGGTGKTPQVAYLVSLLKKKYKIAVLSRGYKRNSTGFVIADATATSQNIGDEAYQLYRQHSDIIVSVDADRTNGINSLLAFSNPPEVIILDDAFQHRKIKAGLNILLTPYDDLYTEDSLLPTGNLRENIKGADRAQLLVVTKCPVTISEKQEYEIASRLQPTLEQIVYFTRIKYADYIQNHTHQITNSELQEYKIILVTGIANPKPLVDYLNKKELKYKHLSYKDHHNFTEEELQYIQNEYDMLKSDKKLILTTEKDYVRIFEGLNNLYYLAIETIFINHQKDFDKLIIDYVGENTRDGKIS